MSRGGARTELSLGPCELSCPRQHVCKPCAPAAARRVASGGFGGAHPGAGVNNNARFTPPRTSARCRLCRCCRCCNSHARTRPLARASPERTLHAGRAHRNRREGVGGAQDTASCGCPAGHRLRASIVRRFYAAHVQTLSLSTCQRLPQITTKQAQNFPPVVAGPGPLCSTTTGPWRHT
jgi:hypothetical protein